MLIIPKEMKQGPVAIDIQYSQYWPENVLRQSCCYIKLQKGRDLGSCILRLVDGTPPVSVIAETNSRPTSAASRMTSSIVVANVDWAHIHEMTRFSNQSDAMPMCSVTELQEIKQKGRKRKTRSEHA
jgi:hypothetical protein